MIWGKERPDLRLSRLRTEGGTSGPAARGCRAEKARGMALGSRSRQSGKQAFLCGPDIP